jgi:hypothetical protein
MRSDSAYSPKIFSFSLLVMVSTVDTNLRDGGEGMTLTLENSRRR